MFCISMVIEFILLVINVSAFCHGLGTNETELPITTKPLPTNETEKVSGM